MLQGVLFAAVMGLVMGWLARARRPAAVTERGSVLSHPKTTLIVGIICTAFFAGLALFAGVFAEAEQRWVAYGFLGFALLGALVIREASRVRHELTNEGIVYRGLWFQYDLISWMELESAHWSFSMKWLLVVTHDKRALRFSGMLNGFDSLARALDERVPRRSSASSSGSSSSRLALNEDTKTILENARQGILPSIWE